MREREQGQYAQRTAEIILRIGPHVPGRLALTVLLSAQAVALASGLQLGLMVTCRYST